MKISAIDFHQNKLKNGVLNFEASEATCCYFLREKNGFLKNKSYGEAVFNSISKREKKKKFHVLEIGGGLGHLASTFNAKMEISQSTLESSYTILDVSPELIKHQKIRLQGQKVSWIQGNAQHVQNLKIKKQVNLVIANEMLADLDVEVFESIQDIKNANIKSEVIQQLITSKASRVIYPVGLIQMLTQLKQVVANDATIVLSEYFTRYGGGQIFNLQGHQEFGLNIHLVAEIIRNLGFELSVVPMIDFLDFNLNFRPYHKEFLNLLYQNVEGVETCTLPVEKIKKIGNKLRIIKKNAESISSAVWLDKFTSYYFLILKKEKENEALSNESVLKHSVNLSIVRNKKDHFLILPYPWKCIKMTKEDEILLSQINGRRSIDKLIIENKREATEVLKRLAFWKSLGIVTSI